MPDLSPDLQILTSVVGTLDLVVLTRAANTDDRPFRIVGPIPPWFADTFGSPDAMTDRSPFLADFIAGDAHDCWQSSGSQAQSGLWQEEVPSGEGRFLEATAINREDQQILLIALVNERHNREQEYLQFAHDAVLLQRKLAKERERKDVLLDCIVNDLSNSLSTILMNIQFVEDRVEEQPLTRALERAEEQAKHQRALISFIADAFDSDLAKFEPALLAGQNGVDVEALANEAIAKVNSLAREKQIHLAVASHSRSEGTPGVVAEQSHLTRVFENLLTTLINEGSRKDSVSIQISDNAESVRVVILRAPQQTSAKAQGPLGKNAAAPLAVSQPPKLDLYFCQMAIKHWGGTLERLSTPDGETQFTFELQRQASVREAKPADSH